MPFEDYVIININLSLNKILRCYREERGMQGRRARNKRGNIFTSNLITGEDDDDGVVQQQTLILNMVLHVMHIYALQGAHTI